MRRLLILLVLLVAVLPVDAQQYLTEATLEGRDLQGHCRVVDDEPSGACTLTDEPQCRAYQSGSSLTFYTCQSSTWTAVATGSGDITAVGPACDSGACFTDGVVTTGTTILIFEGTSADEYEFILIAPTADPVADVSITFPAATGTLAALNGTNTWTGTQQWAGTNNVGTVADDSNNGTLNLAAYTIPQLYFKEGDTANKDVSIDFNDGVMSWVSRSDAGAAQGYGLRMSITPGSQSYISIGDAATDTRGILRAYDQGTLRLYEEQTNGTNYIDVVTPTAFSGDLVITLPGAAAGGANYALTSTGANATLQFTDVGTLDAASVEGTDFGTLTDTLYCTYDLANTEIDCNSAGGGGGDSVSIDSVAVVDPDFQSTADIDFIDTSNVVTADINAGAVEESHLNEASGTPSDGDVLTYNLAGTNFNWEAQSTLAAGTAAALAADPDDCSANQFANTIAANGNLTCAAIADADVPNDITIDLATTATTANNLAANGVDAITEIAAALKSGSDTTLITGTEGSDGHCAQWNADGDLVTTGAACGSSFDSTDVDDTTWSDGSTEAEIAWTFDLSSGTDPIMYFQNGNVDLSTPFSVTNATPLLTLVDTTNSDSDADLQFGISDNVDNDTNMVLYVERAGSLRNWFNLDATTDAITLGHATDVSSITLLSNATDDAAVVLPDDSIGASELDADSITATHVDETGAFAFASLSGKQARNATSVDDDDCTGEQGSWWYDDTDNAFEFCNANSGAPGTIAATSGDITAVGDCTTGDCFSTGNSGTYLESDTDLIMMLDADNDGTESFQINDGADATIYDFAEGGTLTWGGTSVIESGAAFQFGDGTDATLTHTYANTGTNVTIAYSTGAMAVTGTLTATNLSGSNTGDNDEVGTLTDGDLCVNDGSDVQCTVNTESELETALDGTDVLTVNTDDVTSANMATLISDEVGTGEVVFSTGPTIEGKVIRTGTAVDDDDCTGEQGSWWWDSTDSAFEFCNANSGAPTELGGGSGDVTGVGDCTGGDCLDGTSDGGTTITFYDAGGNSVIDWDGSNLDISTAVTATSFTADPSASPALLLEDSDNDGQFQIALSDDANTDGVADLKVDIAGSLTTFVSLDGATETIIMDKPLYILEQADASTDAAGYGQIWVNTATPNELWFTDDGGTDHQLGTGGVTEDSVAVTELDDNTNTAESGDIVIVDTDSDGFNYQTAAELSLQPLDAELTTLGGLTEAQGSLIIGDATPEWSALAIGGSNAVLLSNGTTAAWDTTPAIDCTDCTNVSSSVWTDADPIVPVTSGDDMALGSSHVNTSKLSIDGDADQVQFTVQANSSQTDSIVIIEQSDGTEIFTIDNDATVTIGGSGSLIQGDGAGDLDIDANGQNITLGDGGSTNYVQVTDGGVMTFVGSGDIDLPADSVDNADLADDELVTLAGLSESQGGIIVGNATPEWTVLSIGAANSVLHSNSTTASWQTQPTLDGTNISNVDAATGDDATDFFDTGTIDEARLDANVVLDNAANAYTSGLQDFGGVQLEIPNGGAPTVSAVGDVGVDTTATYDQLKFYGDALRVVHGADSSCKTIESLADTDDNIMLMEWPWNVTIVAVSCTTDGNAATVVFQDSGDNTIETITCDTDTVGTWDHSMTGSSYVGIATGTEALELDTTSESDPAWVRVCFAWTVDAQ